MSKNIHITSDETVNELNKDIRKWSRQQAAKMKQRVQMLTNTQKMFVFRQMRKASKGAAKSKLQREPKLVDSIKAKNHKRGDMVERVSFPFAKHGFYLAVGASRGHSWQKNPRKKKDWYGFVFEESIEQLADTISKHYEDYSVSDINFKGKKNG